MEPLLVKANVGEAEDLFVKYCELLNTSICRDPGANTYLLQDDLVNDLSQLWFVMCPNIVASCITSVEVGDYGMKSLYIQYLSGRELELIMRRLPDLEIWAIHQGCSMIVADVRKGLTRKLKNYGFEELYKVDALRTRIQKEID